MAPQRSAPTTVRAQHLYEAGGSATKVHTRRSVAARPHDRQLVTRIKSQLKYPPVQLTGSQAWAVGRGITAIGAKIDLVIYALAVLPDHVHAVTGAHHFAVDQVIACLQRAATRQLNQLGLHPLQKFRHQNGKIPTPWTKHGWTVFLNTPTAMRRAIRYVEQNPVRVGLPRQHWSCIEPYLE